MNQQEKEKRKSKGAGLTGTLFFHGILLILLILIKLTTPEPPPEEEGILINFGNSEQGTGEIQPTENTTADSQQEAKDEKLSEPEEATPEKTKPQPQLTQETEEAPKINTKKPTPKPVESPKPKPKPVEQPKKPEEPKPDPRALYPGKTNNKGKGSQGSEGETGKPGDQGNPDGSKDATSHTGSGKGSSGISFDLAGRSMLRRPTIDDKSQEFGKVIIEVVVDKEGNVTSVNGPARGSTTSDPGLVGKAKQAAREARFSKSSEGVEEQRGTITFVFSPQ